MRYRLRRDASEPAIVDALRKGGASVFRLVTPVDLLVGYRGKTILAEVKTPGTSYGKQLKPSQQRFADSWNGAPVVVLKDLTDVQRVLNGGENGILDAPKT